MTRCRQRGTDPRGCGGQLEPLFLPPGAQELPQQRARTLLCLRTGPAHGTASHRLASNHCSGICKVRDAAREDVNPSLTRQPWLADLPRPGLKPRQSLAEASLGRRHQRDRAAALRVGSRKLQIHRSFSLRRPDKEKTLHPQAGETSCPAAQPLKAKGSRRSSSSVCSKLGASLLLRQGRLSGCCQLFTCRTQGKPAHVTFASGTTLLGSQAENIQPIKEKWLLINQMRDCPCHCNKTVSKQTLACAEQTLARLLLKSRQDERFYLYARLFRCYHPLQERVLHAVCKTGSLTHVGPWGFGALCCGEAPTKSKREKAKRTLLSKTPRTLNPTSAVPDQEDAHGAPRVTCEVQPAT